MTTADPQNTRPDMLEQATGTTFRRTADLATTGVAVIALAGVLGFVPGLQLFGSIRPDYIPMAPSTAAFFLIFSTVLFLRTRKFLQGVRLMTATLLALLVMAFCLLELAEPFVHIDLNVSDKLFPSMGMVGIIPVGRMSPATAATFAIVSLGTMLLMLQSRSSRSVLRPGNWASTLGVLTVLVGATVLLAYLYGIPLMYGTGSVPMAATTALAFLLLGVALVASAGPESFLMRRVSGDSTSAVLSRVFIPLIVLTVILQSLISRHISASFMVNDAVIKALVVIVIVVITAAVVDRVASSTGVDIDEVNRKLNQALKKMEDSEEHHRTILQTAMNGIWLADLRGCLLEVNESYCKMSGYSEQELLTMSISDLEANESIEEIANRIQLIKERGELQFESRHRRKDGTVFDVEVRVKCQPANGGQYIAFLQDITERKRTEESIVNSYKLLQAIISNSPLRIFWMDTELRYQGCNHAFAMDAGVGCPEDLIGKDDYQLAWKDNAELYRTDDLSVIESGMPRLFYEEQQTKPEGNYIWIRTSKVPLHNEVNEIIGVLGMYEDITERKLMEEELVLFFDLVPDMVCIASSDGYFKKINREWEGVLGYTQEELLTTRYVDFVHPDDIQATMIEVEKQIAGQSTINFTNRYRSKDGSYRWLEWKATPAKNKSTFFAAARDITERKRAEEILRKKDADIEQFLYTVSHDLRSPLVTVKTFMGYLEKDITDGNQEHLTQDIQFIHGAADKMKLMLDELLELSRIGRVETPTVRVSLRDILTETLDILAGVISERKVDISWSDTDLMLSGDHPRLCQIWQNLIENAIKYSREGRIPRIELGVQQTGGETVFFVKDNGIGIDSHYHSKIFGIFEKLDPKSSGAGLGLSMVLRIVEKCGGRIWVESQGNDKGACFFFTLPHAMVQG